MTTLTLCMRITYVAFCIPLDWYALRKLKRKRNTR